jgi:hypothetical protein
MTLHERRNELALYYYNQPYDKCCWKQQEAIDSRIKMESVLEAEKTIGG